MTDINIMGTDMCDTVLYLTRLLTYTGRKVFIRDYTRERRMRSAVPDVKGIDPAEDIIDYAGTGYTYSRASSGQYDTCIRLYDYDRLPDNEEALTIIIASESKAVSDALNSSDWSDFTDAGTRIILFVKQYTGAVRKQFDELIKNAKIKDVFPVPQNAHDQKCAVIAEHNNTYTFNNISAKYQESLIDMLRILRQDMNLSLKDAETIFKKASKGGK